MSFVEACHVQTMIYVRTLSHKERMAPLVKVVKGSGKGAPQVIKEVVVFPSDLIVDRPSENEVILHLGLL